MGKVMSGDGTVTNVPNHVPKGTNPPVAGKEPAKAETPPEAKVEKVEAKTVPEPEKVEEGLDPEDAALSEQVRKKMAKKHRLMREAQEAAAEAERFAEQQFNERRLLETEATTAKQRLAELEKKVAPPPPEDVEPVETDPKYKTSDGQFDWKQYSKDLARFESKKAIQEAKQKELDEQTAAKNAEWQRKQRDSADRARKRHDDFDRVMAEVAADKVRDEVPNFVLSYLSESAEAGEVAYYLGKNPEESQRIAKLSPIRGIAELDKLEERLTKPLEKAPETVSPKASVPASPPPPIEPLSGSGSSVINTDPSKMNYKELRAYERSRALKKRQGG